MDKILIDAGPLYSINNPNDERYLEAQELLSRIQKERIFILTTDYIVDEAVTTLLTRQKGGYRFAVHLLEWVFRQESNIKFEWIAQEHFFKARKVFKRFNKDKEWSFTDCTSYVVMKELKVGTAFTFDNNFAQMGFKILGEE